MARQVLTLRAFVACLACLTIVSGAGIKPIRDVNKIDIEVIPLNSIQDLYPKDAMMVKLNLKARDGDSESSDDQGELITYTVGSRVDGDRVLAQGSNTERFDGLQDVQLELQYPGPDDTSTGAIVTYVEIVVNQSSNIGNAYIVEGGVGFRNIKIILEVGNTSFYKFSASIYGY